MEWVLFLYIPDYFVFPEQWSELYVIIFFQWKLFWFTDRRCYTVIAYIDHDELLLSNSRKGERELGNE